MPPVGDGLTIAYHGLNLGRLSLCANAAGTMRIMLANMLPWAEFRNTYGQPIAIARTGQAAHRPAGRLDRRHRRAGRLGLVADRPGLSRRAGVHHRQDLRQRGAEGSGHRAVHEDARRPVVPARPLFGDNVHDFLAPCIYEGEGEVLGLAFFKSLVKEHGKQFFEPIGKALQARPI